MRGKGRGHPWSGGAHSGACSCRTQHMGSRLRRCLIYSLELARAPCFKQSLPRLTSSTCAEATAESMTPLSAVSIDGHILCVAVASTAGSDDHSVGSTGLLLVNTCRHDEDDKM